MLIQVGTQVDHIALVKEIHGVTKGQVLDALMMGEIQLIGQGGLLNVPLESGPTRKSALASDRELRVAEAKPGLKNRSICASLEARVKFPNSLSCLRFVRSSALRRSFA